MNRGNSIVAKPNKRRISTRLEFLRDSRDERGEGEEGGEERGHVPIGAVRVPINI